MTNIIKKNLITKRYGKRRQVSKNECLYDLKAYLPKLFLAFNKGVKKYNMVSAMFNHESKVRFNAALLNTSIIESVQIEFKDYWRWGKYKRFILKLKDYIFLIKKMDRNNKPMNIKTQHVNTISNQLSLSLFDNEVYQDDPILFFGYKVDRQGEIYSPQITYIDDNNVMWIITEDDGTDLGLIQLNKPSIPDLPMNSGKTVEVSLKGNIKNNNNQNN